MRSRFPFAAAAGTVLALAALLAVITFGISNSSLDVELPGWVQGELSVLERFARRLGIVIAVLGALSLVRHRLKRRWLFPGIAALLAAAAAWAAFMPIFHELFVPKVIPASCLIDTSDPGGGCLPADFSSYYRDLVIRLVIAAVLVAVAAVVLARENRGAPARSTVIRILLLVLAVLPIVNVIGLAGALFVDRAPYVPAPTDDQLAETSSMDLTAATDGQLER